MFVAHISHKIIDGWNVRPLGLDDVIDFCRKHSIYIKQDENQADGELVYYEKDGKIYTFILISPFLDAGMRLWVLWHEIAHYILHYPAAAKFSNACTDKCDAEANYVAAVGMMPRRAIEGKTISEVVHEFGYPRALVELRYEIYQNQECGEPVVCCGKSDSESIAEILERYPQLRRGSDWKPAELKKRRMPIGEKAARIAVLMKQFEKPEETFPF